MVLREYLIIFRMNDVRDIINFTKNEAYKDVSPITKSISKMHLISR